MIVPFAKGPAQAQAPQQAQPSETDMLMALAHMHSMGRIAQQTEQRPDIDHEEEIKDYSHDQNFETLYKQLDGLKDKVKPGNLLRMYDKKGNDFYYQRDDDHEHGFGYYPKPPAETS